MKPHTRKFKIVITLVIETNLQFLLFIYQKQTVTILHKNILSHWGLLLGRYSFLVFVIISKTDASVHSVLCLVAN